MGGRRKCMPIALPIVNLFFKMGSIVQTQISLHLIIPPYLSLMQSKKYNIIFMDYS